MNDYRPLLFVTVLYGACVAGVLRIRAEAGASTRAAKLPMTQRLPWATLILTVAIAIPTALQFAFPSLLTLFRRDAGAIRSGDWWRVITPLFVQDGGVSGSIFNLVSLIVVGTVAERLWGSARWLIVFFVGGITSEVLSLPWQPVGAGNSLANFSLAGSIGFLCLINGRGPRERSAAYLSLGAGLWLLILLDHHGVAVAVGCLIAVVFILVERGEAG